MNVIQMRGAREAPRQYREKMETMLVTPEVMGNWMSPPFQRALRVNERVRDLVEELKTQGGCIGGVITLAHLVHAPSALYLLDGQHRREAALITGLKEFIVNVRICSFEDMAAMGEEYVRLNSSLVHMRPDDLLRGLEQSLTALKIIGKGCSFVGYDNIRRGTSSPMLSMAVALRCWQGCTGDTPKLAQGGVINIAREMTEEQAEALVKFLVEARSAWGNDHEYSRLWSGLNLTMCMWLWRQMVTNKDTLTKRCTRLTKEQFKKCLMSLSTSNYIDWLHGRLMRERDRAPCYARIKTLFVSRCKAEGIKNPKMPQPPWAA